MPDQYKKPFLKQVIVRIDFPSPIEVVRKRLPAKVNEAALGIFPIAEPRQLVERELQISKQEVRTSGAESTEWQFHGRHREKTLSIAPRWVFIVYNRYPSFETLRGEFQQILLPFFDAFKDEHVSRLGLRYINVIEMPDGDPLVWEDFLNPRMLCVTAFYPNKEHIARVFHNLELAFGDMNLRYQFGVQNPDYPAPVRRKQFVLDLDAYSQGLLTADDIFRDLDKAHGRVQELFEASITDRLREVMNA